MCLNKEVEVPNDERNEEQMINIENISRFEVKCVALRVYPSYLFCPKRTVQQFVVFVNMKTLENKHVFGFWGKNSVPACN